MPTLKAMLIDEKNKSTGSVGGCKLLQNKRYDNHSLRFSMDPQLRKEIEWLDQNDKRKLSEIDLLLKTRVPLKNQIPNVAAALMM